MVPSLLNRILPPNTRHYLPNGGGTARSAMPVRGLLGSAADSFPIIPPCAFSQHLTGPVAPPLW